MKGAVMKKGFSLILSANMVLTGMLSDFSVLTVNAETTAADSIAAENVSPADTVIYPATESVPVLSSVSLRTSGEEQDEIYRYSIRTGEEVSLGTILYESGFLASSDIDTYLDRITDISVSDSDLLHLTDEEEEYVLVAEESFDSEEELVLTTDDGEKSSLIITNVNKTPVQAVVTDDDATGSIAVTAAGDGHFSDDVSIGANFDENKDAFDAVKHSTVIYADYCSFFVDVDESVSGGYDVSAVFPKTVKGTGYRLFRVSEEGVNELQGDVWTTGDEADPEAAGVSFHTDELGLFVLACLKEFTYWISDEPYQVAASSDDPVSFRDVLLAAGVTDEEYIDVFLAYVREVSSENPEALRVELTEDNCFVTPAEHFETANLYFAMEDGQTGTITVTDERPYEEPGTEEPAVEDPSAEGSGIEAAVSYPDAVEINSVTIAPTEDKLLPEDAESKADVVDGEEAISAVAPEAENPSAEAVTEYKVFDIDLENVNKEEYESFDVELDISKEAAISGGNFKLYHILEDGTYEEVPVTVNMTKDENGNEIVDTITFTTASFSDFVLVYTVESYVRTASGETWKITATYAPDAGIPSNAQLYAEEIAAGEADYDSYVKQSAADLGVLASSVHARAFDIRLWNPATGEIYQPGEKGVEITVELQDDSFDQFEKFDVLHFAGGAEEGSQPVDSTLDDQKVMFNASGFSTYVLCGYTVDFHWGDYTYSIKGESDILLSALLENLGITEISINDVTGVRFSNSNYIEVTQSGSDWLLTSVGAFDTNETLTLSLTNGQDVVIQVTAEDATPHNPKISSFISAVDNNNVTYTLVVEAEGDMDYEVNGGGSFPVVISGLNPSATSEMSFVSGSGKYTFEHTKEIDPVKPASTVNGAEVTEGETEFTEFPVTVNHMYDGDKITLTYKVDVTKGVFDNGNLKITNTASITNTGNSKNDTSDDRMTIETVVPTNYTPLTREMTNLEGSWATWKVTVNPYAFILNNSEPMTLLDTFDDGVEGHAGQTIDYSSIQVSDSAVVYDYSGKTGSFTIPDSSFVTITYRTRVTADAGEEATFQGTAVLKGTDGDIASATATEQHIVNPSASDVAGFGTNYMVKLYVYADGQMQTGLEGAKFILMDANKRPLEYKLGDNKGQPVTFTTDDTGHANVELHEEDGDVLIEKNTVYYLEMIQTPEAYQKDTQLYSFMITDNPSYDSGGVYTYFNGDTLKIRLYPVTPGLRVTLRFSGNYELTEDEQNAVEAILQTLNYDSSEWETVEVIPYSEAQYGAITFETALEPGTTYRVIQMNERPWNIPADVNVTSTYYCMINSGESDPAAEPQEFQITNTGDSVNVVIDNRYEEPKLTLTKMDKLTGETLQGAVFTAKKAKDDSDVTSFVTDENGEIVITGGSAFESETLYYIEETTAPAHYLIPLTSRKAYFYWCNDPDPETESVILADLPEGETAVNLTKNYDSLTIDNQKETVTVPVMKTWQGNTWPEHVSSVVIGLYKSVAGADPVQVTDQGGILTVTLTEEHPFNNTAFKDLPSRDDNDKNITYSVKEEHVYNGEGTDIIADYVQEYGISDAGVYVVRNREATSLTVNKKWYDYSGSEITDPSAQPEVMFDVYQSSSTIPDDVRADGITNEEMTAFVSTLTKIRSGLSLDNAGGWTMSIDDLPKKDDLDNPYYYYVLETVPSFGDELYAADEAEKSITIQNTIEPPAVSLTVEKAELVNDPRPESVYRDFTFTLELNKGEHPIRHYTVFNDGSTELTTDWNGKVTFTLKPENNITLMLPDGVTATVTEASEQEYTTVSFSEKLTDLETEDGRIFRYEVNSNQIDAKITYTNTLRVICMVEDVNHKVLPFESLKSALNYIRAHEDTTYVEGKATIQMLEDYDIPATDIFDVRESENIVLTTATTDTSAPFHFKTDRAEDTARSYITRGDHTSSMLSNNGGVLTLENILLDGANKSVAGNGGLVNSTGTLNIKENTTLRNSAVSGKGGAVYSSGTFNMPGGTITGNSASSGSAVYLVGTMNMSGGSVTDNSGSEDGAVVIEDHGSVINLTGNAVIFDNTNASNAAANLYNGTTNDNVIYIPTPGLSADAHIGVTAMTGHREIGEQFASSDAGLTQYFNRFSNDIYGYVGKLKEGTSTNIVWDGLTLEINKIVNPVGANPNDRFTIRIASDSIKKSRYNIDGTVDYTVTPAKPRIPGVIELRNVKAGDRITISPLPVGSYTISETISNYTPTFSVNSTVITDGVFDLNTSSTVDVTNVRRQADVSLTKSLRDELVGSDPVAFPFDITLTEADGTPVANYTLAEGLTTDGSGRASFTMTPRMTESVVRNFKAPVGANMTITEEANPDYRVKTSGKTMPSESEGSSITDEDTDNANIFAFRVTDDGAAIIYENERKMGDIELRKELSGKVSKEEAFKYTITLRNSDDSPAGNYVLYRDPSDPSKNISTDANGKAETTFVIEEDQSSKDVQLKVPEGTKLIVEETPVTKGSDVYDISYSINGRASTTGTTAEIPNVTEDDDSIVFTNARKMRTVTVTNTVGGYAGNVQPFTFTATVTDGNANDYDEHGFVDGVQTFELTNGQSKVLTVPYNATLRVEEGFLIGYDTSVKHGSAAAVQNRLFDEFSVSDNVTVAFTNNQLINIILENKTSHDLTNVVLTFGYASKMYRVNSDKTGQDTVPMTNKTARVDVAAGETAILEVNHQTSQTAEQTYKVTGTTPTDGYYYTIKNEPSFHEFANPAILRVYSSTAFTVEGKLRYSTSDSTITFTEQPLVSFDANGGAWTTEMEGYHDKDGSRQVYQFAVDSGETVSRPDPDPVYPTDEGFPFLGWTTNEGVANAGHEGQDAGDVSEYLYDFDTPVTGPLTLYAIWAKPACDTRVVTVENACQETLTVTATLTQNEAPVSGYTMADGVVTNSNGTASFTLPANQSKNLTTPDGSKLVLTVEEDAIGVSSQFTDADTENKSFTIDSVKRDGTVVFSPGICKITDSDGAILYDSTGQPAVYTTLKAAFTAYNGTLYTEASHSAEATPAYVKMLIDEYEVPEKLAFPTKNVTLTTAGKGDTDFPYIGVRDRATLLRPAGFADGSLFTHQASATTVTLTNIILDGNDVKLARTADGGLIYLNKAGAVLNIETGTTLRNVQYNDYSNAGNARGGAIFLANGTLNVKAGLFTDLHASQGGAIAVTGGTLSVTGTEASTQFENCYAEGQDGGAIYYNNSNNPLIINGGSDKNTPGILFTNCVAKNTSTSDGGDGGAIYVTTSNNKSVMISGSAFTECSAKTGKTTNAGNGGGAICANNVQDLTVSNCLFDTCDTMSRGGAIVVMVKSGQTVSIVNSSFENCNCKGQGGALAVYQPGHENQGPSAAQRITKLSVTGSTFTNCSSGTQNGSGGAIQSYVPCNEFTDSDFTDCWAGKEGGAVNNYFSNAYINKWDGSYMTLTGCHFTRCRAEDRYEVTSVVHYGGAVNTKALNVTVDDCHFTECVSTLREGGALHLGGCGTGSISTVTNSTFTDCTAKKRGGALFSSAETLTVSGSTFSGCSTAGNGGAVYHGMNCRGETYVKKTTTITDCQFISDCHAEENGGAVWSASQNTQIIECTIQNCSAGSGGAVYFSEKDVKTNTGSVGGISNVETSTSPQNVSLPTGALARGKITDGSITGCEAGAGSAVYVGHSAIFSGTSDTSPLNVTGNTVSGINDGAIHGGMLYFEGNVQVKDNTCSEDSSCMHDVLMQENNTQIIYTTASGLAPEASIGVYVPDAYFDNRGIEGKAFGTWWRTGGGEYLENFFNDRDDGLVGMRISDTDVNIYWGRYICKITDAEGNTLKRTNGKDAVYQRLSLALDDFVDVYNHNQEKAVYIKIMIPNYDIQQTEEISNFPAADITITTASKNEPDNKYPYIGEEGTVCTISRTNSDNQLFHLNTEGATVQFENITLDGRRDKTAQEGTFRLIQADKGDLVIKSGTTLQYGYTAADNTGGGAILISSEDASLQINSTEAGDVVFDHCVQNNEKDYGGGAIYSAGNVTITSDDKGKTSFKDCSAKRGGAIMIDNNSDEVNLSITKAEFKNCESLNEGGAIYVNNNDSAAETTIIKSVFENCDTSGSDQNSSGGAVNTKTGSLSVEDSRFVNCHAKGSGGAIDHGSDGDNRVSTNITGTEFIGCGTTGTEDAYGYGGSVSTRANSVIMNKCTVENSVSYNAGGGLYCQSTSASAVITDTTFDHCSVKRGGGSGGAVYSEGSSVTINGSSVIDNCNAPAYSGAVHMNNTGSTLTVAGKSIIENCYADKGGAVYLNANVTMNITGSPEFTQNGYATIQGELKQASNGACIYLEEGSLLNLSGGPKFSRNILPLRERIVNGGELINVRQDIYLEGYSSAENAISIHVTGDLTGDTIWVWPEEKLHREPGMQFATTEGTGTVSEDSLSKFRNAREDSITGCSNGEFLAGVRIGSVDTLVYWDKMYSVFFKKIDNKAVPVSGAEFTLYKDAACTVPVATETSANGETDTNPRGELLDKGVVYFASIRIGAYYMLETEKPDSFRDNDTKYIVLVGSPYLSNTSVSHELWENDGPLDVPNAETLVQHSTVDVGKFYGIFPLSGDGKANLSKNLAADENGVVNMRDDYEAWFMKTDSAGIPLPNAEFTIYVQEYEDGHPKTYDNGYPVLDRWSRGEITPEPVSSADGTSKYKKADGSIVPKGVVYFAELPIGTYYLLETDYPIRDGNNRRSFYVESDRVLRLKVNGLNDQGISSFELSELQDDGSYAPCSKDSQGNYLADNKEAVCKLTDRNGTLLYEVGRDGKTLYPAIYATLEEGFAAAQNHVLYDTNGNVVADAEKNPDLKLQALKDFSVSAPIVYNSPRDLIFTTAALKGTDADPYVFVTTRTSDIARAEITRAYGGESLITINNNADMTLQNISLNGAKASHDGRAIHVTSGKLTVLNDTRMHDFRQTGENQKGGAILMDDGTELYVDGGSSRSAVFANNEVSGTGTADGGAVAIGENCVVDRLYNVQFTGNITQSSTADAGRGGALYTASNVPLTNGVFRNNTSNYGSAIYVENGTDSEHVVRVTIDSGTISGNKASAANGGAINVGGINSQLHFQGNPRIFDNGSTSNPGEQRNVVLSEDSNAIIWTTEKGLTGGKIGVYVIDGPGGTIFSNHGLQGKPFGTWLNTQNLKAFVNDRLLALYGGRNEDDTSDTFIYWQSDGIDISFLKTDGKGAALNGAEFSLFTDAACTHSYDNRKAVSANGTVLFERIPNGMYYMKETKIPDGYNNSYEKDTAGNPIQNVYVVLVGDNMLTVNTPEVAALGLTTEAIQKQTIRGGTELKYAFFLLDSAGKARTDADIAEYGILNLSNETHKVVIRKRNNNGDTPTPLIGAEFTIQRRDMSYIINDPAAADPYKFTSLQNGVLYIGALSDGYYFLHETKAPAGYTQTGWFVVKVDSEGAKISALYPEFTAIPTNLDSVPVS